MQKVSHVLTDLQVAYLNSLAERWKCTRSRVLRVVVQEHMADGSIQSGSLRNSTIPDRDDGSADE